MPEGSQAPSSGVFRVSEKRGQLSFYSLPSPLFPSLPLPSSTLPNIQTAWLYARSVCDINSAAAAAVRGLWRLQVLYAFVFSFSPLPLEVSPFQSCHTV